METPIKHGIKFGKVSNEYAQYRKGFPTTLFEYLENEGVVAPKKKLLDIGTGTGNLSRAFAKLGLEVDALDPDIDLLDSAKDLSISQNLNINFHQGVAENLPFDSNTFDVITAGQCWHWFDGIKSAKEAFRVLKNNSFLVITHFDWILFEKSVTTLTENLILKHNPNWTLSGGNGIYPLWFDHMLSANFSDLKALIQDVKVSFTHDEWLGRIRACSGVGPSMTKLQIENFDNEHKESLKKYFPQDLLVIPHRLFVLVGKKI